MNGNHEIPSTESNTGEKLSLAEIKQSLQEGLGDFYDNEKIDMILQNYDPQIIVEEVQHVMDAAHDIPEQEELIKMWYDYRLEGEEPEETPEE